MKDEKRPDWLLERALDAIAAERPEMADWCDDKAAENTAGDRLAALRFICFSLDARNREIVAQDLGLDPLDLAACRRVLQKI